MMTMSTDHENIRSGSPEDSEAIERLALLDSAAVSDALDRLGLRGVISGISPLFACPRIVGPVITVEIVLADKGVAATRHLGTAAIEQATPGDIIFVGNEGRIEMAAWGGNLALAAKLRGVGGIIVDGASRDVDEIHELGLPLFARAATPVTARGRVVEKSFNQPLDISSIRIFPGDFVIADMSGVVILPRSSASAILAQAEAIARSDAEIAARIRSGEPVSHVMGGGYEKMLKPS